MMSWLFVYDVTRHWPNYCPKYHWVPVAQLKSWFTTSMPCKKDSTSQTMSFQGKTCWGVSNRWRSADGEQELRQSGRCGIITNKIPAVFVLRKNGRKMKKRTKEEEMRKVIKGFLHQMRKVIRGFPHPKSQKYFVGLGPEEVPSHLAGESQSRQLDTPPEIPCACYTVIDTSGVSPSFVLCFGFPSLSSLGSLWALIFNEKMEVFCPSLQHCLIAHVAQWSQGSKNRPPSGHLRLKNPVWRVKKSF